MCIFITSKRAVPEYTLPSTGQSLAWVWRLCFCVHAAQEGLWGGQAGGSGTSHDKRYTGNREGTESNRGEVQGAVYGGDEEAGHQAQRGHLHDQEKAVGMYCWYYVLVLIVFIQFTLSPISSWLTPKPPTPTRATYQHCQRWCYLLPWRFVQDVSQSR